MKSLGYGKGGWRRQRQMIPRGTQQKDERQQSPDARWWILGHKGSILPTESG